jgi:hypothetical protein
MGGHVNRNTSTPVGRVTGNTLWPTHPSGSASKPTNRSKPGGRQTVTIPQAVVVVPDFVSKPQDYLPSKYGYQEVHKIYDEMRAFFAKRATSTYQNEVATIKVTLMTMKPNCRHPQMVTVHKIMATSIRLDTD